MKTTYSLHLLACTLRKCIPFAAFTALAVSSHAQPATLLAYWTFNDASNPTQAVAAVGGFVGVFTNSVDLDSNNMTSRSMAARSIPPISWHWRTAPHRLTSRCPSCSALAARARAMWF